MEVCKKNRLVANTIFDIHLPRTPLVHSKLWFSAYKIKERVGLVSGVLFYSSTPRNKTTPILGGASLCIRISLCPLSL